MLRPELDEKNQLCVIVVKSVLQNLCESKEEIIENYAHKETTCSNICSWVEHGMETFRVPD